MNNKNQQKKDTELHDDIDIELEETEFEGVSQSDKLKKLRNELKEAKHQAQEYLTGWQKERASFANYKAEEEKKRKDRLEGMKLQLISDFFPVLDSFDMAFANREAWEKVDPAWRTGVEYIHTQLMNTLNQYNVSLVSDVGVEFDPKIHDPVEHVIVKNKDQDHKVITVIQKGYRSGDVVLRPAKVKVGKYENH
ncbi:nucleotide exchange factor GrpE [Patescibacteria group bacterium]|nr:nucleotide exchange factor GrpE [Patescibacteria group bacterium]